MAIELCRKAGGEAVKYRLTFSLGSGGSWTRHLVHNPSAFAPLAREF